MAERMTEGDKIPLELRMGGSCRRCGLRVFRDGPLVTAGNAPKEPMPDLNVLREREHADLSGLALGTRKRVDEDIRLHDDQPFVGGAPKKIIKTDNTDELPPFERPKLQQRD
jgi:hypothetical protein